MKLLLISDVHANLPALEAIFADCKDEWEECWFLGDAVGYGPDPTACIDLLKSQVSIFLAGNHDLAISDPTPIKHFNVIARENIRIQRELLSQDYLDFLSSLSSICLVGSKLLVHGSPRDSILGFMSEKRSRKAELAYLHEQGLDITALIYGHTHFPTIEYLAAPSPDLESIILINPGSVGQPRDNDYRASYVLWDPDTNDCVQRRVPYDIAKVQRAMIKMDFPNFFIERIGLGV